MATTLPNDLYSEFLVCSFCTEGFTQPKILPCLHTFCQSCLERHLARSTTATASLWFLCPQCRNITDVPQQGLEGFRTNNFVLRLKEIFDSGKDSVSKDRVNVVEDKRDDFEKKPHHKHPPRRVAYCRCSEEEVRFYCVTCEYCVCGGCMKADHRCHTIDMLEERSNKARDQVMSTVHNAREEITFLADGNNDLEKYKKTLRKARDDTMGKVKKQAKIMKDIINKLEEKTLKDIDEVYKEERDKTDQIIRVDIDLVSLLKNLNKFSETLLKKGTDSELIGWKDHIEQQFQNLRDSSMKKEATSTKANPLDIRYKESPINIKDSLEKMLGEVQYGRNVDIVDYNVSPRRHGILAKVQSQHGELDAQLNAGEGRIIESRIHKGKLVKSFSIFTDGSHFSPRATSLTLSEKGDVIVADRSNKCVKFFASDGGMYKKIHTSESVWGLAVLTDGTVAVTDKTVHLFDETGRLEKVLRQQPRDSHGVAATSSGHIVVSDCASRCIYIMATVGGTIKRIITQRERKRFRCPQYVAVNNKDDVIVSDSGTHCVSVFSEQGQLLAEYGVADQYGSQEGQLNCPAGVATDKLGNIIVCDKMNNRVVLLDPDGRLMCNIVEGKENIFRPQDVIIDQEGNAVVAEEQGRIRIFKYREIK